MTLGFIGAGNMATAIVDGIISSGTHPADKILVYDISPERQDAFRRKGVRPVDSSVELASLCNMIVLAVKPQNFAEVLDGIKEAVNESKLFITIAAGISIGYIQNALGCGCPVVRAMPNTPLLIGKGATALCRSDNVSDGAFETVKSFFASCGMVAVLDEKYMNAVISVNGSSPAYIYLFAKAVVDNAVKQGIPAQTAMELFCQTLVGSAGMLLESGSSPTELIRMVSSPGGTTLKALDTLYEYQFEKAVDEAMLACTKRAEELGR